MTKHRLEGKPSECIYCDRFPVPRRSPGGSFGNNIMRARRLIFTLTLICVALMSGVFVWANWPEHRLAPGVRADSILVLKSERQLELYASGKLLKRYAVSLGRRPVGPKEREGDKRTPEGLYVVAAHKADSSFHRALRISYPSESDRKSAEKRGEPPGGDIMIHGIRNGLGFIGKLQRFRDWTSGCVALTNPEIEKIYAAVADGTPIEIRP